MSLHSRLTGNLAQERDKMALGPDLMHGHMFEEPQKDNLNVAPDAWLSSLHLFREACWRSPKKRRADTIVGEMVL